MNICIESSLLNYHKRSGLLTYTEGLIESLSKQDFDNNYSLIYYSLKRKPSQMPGIEQKNFKKYVLRVPDQLFKGRQFWIDSLALPSFFKKNKCRIFHRPSGYTMPKVPGVFNILTVHDLRTLTIGDQLWKQNIGHYRKTLNMLDICVVVSECTKIDLLKHFQMDEKKIKVVYLGADQRFQPASQDAIEAVKAKYGIKRPFLLSIGSVPRKNIDGIIRGFAASGVNKDFLLILSCNMDVEKYRQLAIELNVAKDILFLSNLKDEEVVALYSSCHCFVFPSLYEGFGLPIVEAMQCGAPVITSNISSCPEVAGNSALLVNPQNITEIASAIQTICKDDSLRKQLIQKGFLRAKDFSWERFGQEMRKIYALA